jgi:hypothetical protein
MGWQSSHYPIELKNRLLSRFKGWFRAGVTSRSSDSADYRRTSTMHAPHTDMHGGFSLQLLEFEAPNHSYWIIIIIVTIIIIIM